VLKYDNAFSVSRRGAGARSKWIRRNHRGIYGVAPRHRETHELADGAYRVVVSPAIESTVRDLYHRASLDPARESGAVRLALGLRMKVRFMPLRVRARVSHRDNAIEIAEDTSDVAAEFLAGHEIAHVAVDRRSCGGPQLEALCNSMGAAIVAPAPAMYLMRATCGYDVQRMACLLVTSEMIAALRWGEVFEEQVAVVEPGRVRRSGPPIALSDNALRRIALAGGGDGVRAVRLSRGTMLVAAE
jgi:hypothetical protein